MPIPKSFGKKEFQKMDRPTAGATGAKLNGGAGTRNNDGNDRAAADAIHVPMPIQSARASKPFSKSIPPRPTISGAKNEKVLQKNGIKSVSISPIQLHFKQPHYKY